MAPGRESPFTLVALLVLSALSGACGVGDVATPSTQHADGPAPPSADGASGGARRTCSEPAEDRPAGSACVSSVEGSLVEDGSNSPLSLFVSICGGVCFAGSSDAGAFRVPIGRFVDLSTYVLHVDGRPEHTDRFVRLPRSSSDALVLAEPVQVPRLDQRGPTLPESPVASPSVLRAGDVTLTLAPNTAIAVAFTDVARGAEGRLLRSGRVSAEVSRDPNLLALHALAPFGATLVPEAEIAIVLPPSPVVADGTTLDLVALDEDLLSAEVGTLRVVGTATVHDGVARSDAGHGIGKLTWIGVRKSSR